MLFTIIFWAVIAACIITPAVMFYRSEYGNDPVGALVGGLLGSILALFVGMLMFVGSFLFFSWDHKYEDATLKSLDTSMGTQGQFNGGLFVSYGYINTVPIYTFYVQDVDGAYEMVSVNAEGSRVIETNDKPHAECYVDNVFNVPAPFGDDNIFSISSANRCDLYVPPGSVGNSIDPNIKE